MGYKVEYWLAETPDGDCAGKSEIPAAARDGCREDSDLDVFVLVKKGESFELGERIVGVAVGV